MTLRDALGRVVLTQTQPLADNELSVDAHGLRPGIYQVQIVLPDTTQMSRVVVE